MVFDENGELLARACQYEEELLLCDLGDREACSQAPVLDDLAEVYGALRLGLRDYVEKNGFNHVGIALSGGIDSALVALIAADAVGADRVTCVVMPSPHSSEETQGDARDMAKRLGVELIEITIESMMGSYEESLEPILDPRPEDDPDAPRDAARPSEPDLVAENLQARIRGNLMMALSNRHGWLVLTTGNKSEMSVGYATLYGDMAGGFAVIKDVPKTLVYKLVEWRNAQGDEPVPAGIIERPPSAELRPDQLDTDSLPPYEVLDRVLEAYVEQDRSPAEIAADGHPARGRRRGDRPGRPRRVQAPPGAARDQDHAPRLRPRPAPADHQPLRAIAMVERPSCPAIEGRQGRSTSLSTPQRRVLRDVQAFGAGRTATLNWASAQRRPSESVTSASQTQVVRPRWRAWALTSTEPSVIGRRKLIECDCPIDDHSLVDRGRERSRGSRCSPPARRGRRHGPGPPAGTARRAPRPGRGRRRGRR